MTDHQRDQPQGRYNVRWTPLKGFVALYAGQYLFLGMQLPFFPGWLDERGFSAASIGWLTGGALCLRLLFAPAFAYRLESLADPRTGMRGVTALLALLALCLLTPVPNSVVAVAAIGMLFLYGLLVPLSDTAVLRADRRGELAYGRARGMGSFFFIVANLLGGWAISQGGDNVIVLWMAAAALSAFIATLFLPREKGAGTGADRPRPSLALAAKLFRSRSFLLMLFASGLIQGSHATYYTFSELHWSALGYPSYLIGALWTTGVVTEIALLFYMKPLVTRLGPVALIGAGAVAAIIRWPIAGLSPPLAVLFVIQTLHALTFAATYAGTIEFIGRAVPDEYRTTAMTIVASLGIGAVTGLAAVVAGQMFSAEAPLYAYLLMSGMGGAALILTVLLGRRWDGGPLHAVAQD
ncbi:MFS transporter [Parvularcula sp. LCG005]|uniref:MFS transporter n=1 Tax=Parvularcula sp. LCG005 TaxID=3078805 RepID=UPI00294365DD|nr:MFS transporter [Parvularcula sp. LCG005]WOI54124.1 MFS transporter [Parvularcula sp. LCG005]